MKVTFSKSALKEYFEWQEEDRKTLRKINKLIIDIQRNGLMVGIGKPEKLKHRDGYSRTIDEYNRLEYDGDGKTFVEILSCKGHYEDS